MAQAGANEHWGGIAIKVGSTLPMHLPSAPYLLPLSPFFHEFDHAFHLAIKVQKTLFFKTGSNVPSGWQHRARVFPHCSVDSAVNFSIR